MNHIFLELLNNALVTNILIIAVIITRLCIKKAPKWMACILWGFVACKLVFPFHIESILSLIPSAAPIPVDIEYQTIPQIISGVDIVNETVNPVLSSNFTANEVASINPIQVVISVAFILWLVGIIIMCIYSFISFYLLKKRVAESKHLFENVYSCDEVDSPFILGIVRPRIYVPSGMESDMLKYIFEHEKAHLKRLDHIWKPLGFLILTVYWFDPLCWIAYVLMCKDIEFACDELVIKDKDKEWKATYCQALLDCSVKKRIIASCPVAFGEVSVKDRVKGVLNYKKPAFWIIIIAVCLSIIVAVCFMTNPKQDADGDLAVEDSVIVTENTKDTDDFETSGQRITSIADKWAQAICNSDGKTIVSMANEEVLENFETVGALERQGDDVYFSYFGSSPMFSWHEGMVPYKIVDQDDVNHTVDIIYYVWTSDPHVFVCREQIKIDPAESLVCEEKLSLMSDISTAEEFLAAYPSDIRETLMSYYDGNDLGEALNNNALLSSSDYYKDLFDPATAACTLLNIANNGNLITEVETSRDKDFCDVKIYFQDGIIDVSMCRPYGENGIWIPYGYSVVNESENPLTLQELVRMVTSDSWFQTQREEGITFWNKYTNLYEDEIFHESSLTCIKSLQLDYNGTSFELQVYYWPEDTAKEYGYKEGALDLILLRNIDTDDAILLYDSDSIRGANTDIESFLVKKYELPEELMTGNESEALNGEILYSNYNVGMFLNFGGCLFENSNYKEPTHGEGTPRAWYSLGGVGICIDPDYSDLETFVDGKLMEYQYLGNHMSRELITTINKGEYSGCLYKYNLDLVTASETDLLQNGESGEAEYWVIFFTKGQGEALYVKFFNCDYYSQQEALNNSIP